MKLSYYRTIKIIKRFFKSRIDSKIGDQTEQSRSLQVFKVLHHKSVEFPIECLKHSRIFVLLSLNLIKTNKQNLAIKK